MKRGIFLLLGIFGVTALLASVTGYDRIHLGNEGFEFHSIGSRVHRIFLLLFGSICMLSCAMQLKRRPKEAAFMGNTAVVLLIAYYFVNGCFLVFKYGFQVGIQPIIFASLILLIYMLLRARVRNEKNNR
jgi:CHASE2 domain-containing sensor protein